MPYLEPDNQCLERFARSRDEAAFREIVDRHYGLVLGAARRRLRGNDDLAREVAQNVFATLARKAGSLISHPCLPAWLQKTAAHEAMRASRKESNHAKKMKRWREEETNRQGHEEAGDSAMAESLPHLDDAMAALGENDRRTLIMRFYEGLSFKAIAARIDKSEAACQKQAQRAIAKLAKQLRRRGVTVSIAVLTAGLTVELTKGASTAASLATANAALSQSMPASAALMGNFSLLAMKSHTAIIAGAILLLACATSGFVAGRAAAPDPVVVQSEAPPSPEPAVLRNVRTSPAVRKQVPLPEPEDERDVLRRLLGFASNELRGEGYDRLLTARGRARIGQIPPEMIPDAMAMVGEMPGGFEGQSALSDALLERWAGFEGAAACEFSLEHRSASRGDPPVCRPLQAWAGHDPQAALDWYLARTAEGHPGLKEKRFGEAPKGSRVRSIMASWIRKDIDGAIAALDQLDSEWLRTGALWGLAHDAGPLAEREKLFDALASWPEREWDSALSHALNQHSKYRPEGAADWIDNHPNDAVRLDTSTARQVLRNWLQSDSEAAADWWVARPHAGGLGEHIREMTHLWAHLDLDATAEWMARQELSRDFDPAFVRFNEEIARRDPIRAFAWAEKLRSEKHRNNAMHKAVGFWKHSDPAAAREAIRAAEIPEEVKTKLVAMTEGTGNQPNSTR